MAFTTVVLPEPEPPAIPITNILIFCVFRCSREWDDVTDVGHTCHEEQQPLEAKAETAVRAASEPAGIDVPLKVIPAHLQFVNACFKFLERSLSFGTSNDLTDLREKHIHCADSLSVLILLHIEGLDVLRIAGEDDRLLEMLLNEIENNLPIQQLYIDKSNESISVPEETNERLDDVYQMAVTLASTMMNIRTDGWEAIVNDLMNSEPWCKYPAIKEKLLKEKM